MTMWNGTKRRVATFLATALAVQVSGCGTLLYPERKGQTGGKADATVVLLDCVGLLFFIIPGVIAFIVDFDNGTIYLPGTEGERGIGTRRDHSRLDAPDAAPWTAVHVGPGALDAKSIRSVVGRNTGAWVGLDDPRFHVTAVASVPGSR
jgi:hypothetical protein